MEFDIREYPTNYPDYDNDQDYLTPDDVEEIKSDSHFSFDDCYDEINLDENPF